MMAVFQWILIFVISGLYIKEKKNRKKIKKQEIDIQKDNLIMETLVQWIQIEHEKKSVSYFLNQLGYKTVALYGYGYVGRELEKILLDDGTITISCVIDKNVLVRMNGEKIIHPSNELPDTDVIVVTSLYYYQEIKEELIKLGVTADIVSFDSLLYQL